MTAIKSPSACRSLLITTLFLVAAIAVPGAAQRPTAIPALQSEALARLTQYIRINTTNPPGNEAATMKFFADIFTAEGIQFDTASSAPGRGNIWARLKGGPKPALVLLSHMDVVPADPRYWSVDPFAATVKDSMLYGRGTLDTKSLGIEELEAFLALHRARTPLDRDVIFMATADEEAGASFGAGWVVEHHPEAFKGAGFVLNEGGGGSVQDGREQFGIEVTQKVRGHLLQGPGAHRAAAVARRVREHGQHHQESRRAAAPPDRDAGARGAHAEYLLHHHFARQRQGERDSAGRRGAARLPAAAGSERRGVQARSERCAQ